DHLCKIGRCSRQKCLVLLLDIVAPRQHRKDARNAENNQENDDECRYETSQDRLDRDEFAIGRTSKKTDMARKLGLSSFPTGFAMRPRRRAIRVGARHIMVPPAFPASEVIRNTPPPNDINESKVIRAVQRIR